MYVISSRTLCLAVSLVLHGDLSELLRARVGGERIVKSVMAL